jgi:hypothetical protein
VGCRVKGLDSEANPRTLGTREVVPAGVKKQKQNNTFMNTQLRTI